MSRSQDKRIAVEKKAGPTPGPWYVGDGSACGFDGEFDVLGPDNCGIACMVGTAEVAKFPRDKEANATLMAASWSLLEACKPVIREAKEREDYMHDTWNEDAHVELTLTIKEIRAIHSAIALATKGREA